MSTNYDHHPKAAVRKRTRMLKLVSLPVTIAFVSVFALAVSGLSGAGTTKTAVAPTNTSPPTTSGTTTEGQVLTADNGAWSGTAPITYTHAWQRCDASGGSCSPIGGATAVTYTLKNPDVGNTLRVVTTATNTDGAKAATSVPTAVVKAATVTPPAASNGCATTGGTVAIASVTSPARLNIDQFQVNPATITYATRSVTARFHVTACGGSVQGALVLATVVPYGLFASANEQTTGADGWATVDLTALSGFPVSAHQQLLVTFVRARKSSDDILGGISSRRLVSFKVARS
ncbi:MAG: hypothetical protein F2663_01955 [Actinobacteria bacterium]|uniref:Unannotated protein n=1 Tax=freshwater metagenome TaxID=449393 RepID=A0A6J6NPA0_9ZZZZ|nr:hypothetical protein [Actinomycetota bacterium]